MNDIKIIRKALIVSGAVQGVGFRYRASHAASLLGVTGWVRNDDDGTVSMEIQGTEEQIDKLLAMVNQGSYIDIQNVKASKIPTIDDERSFRIRGY